MNPDKSEDILSTYKITELCGVSIRMQSFLNYHGVYLCGDMKKIPISILGDRFGNIGRKINKTLIKYKKKTLLQHILEKLLKYKIYNVILPAGYKHQNIKK